MNHMCARPPAPTGTRQVVVAVAMAIAGGAFGCAITRWLDRRRASDHDDHLDAIGRECERISAAALLLVAGQGDELATSGWGPIDAEITALEHRVTTAANSAPRQRRQRGLDQLAGALISLRAAVEADTRLRADATAPATMRHACDDVVVLRCEDLTLLARAFGASGR